MGNLNDFLTNNIVLNFNTDIDMDDYFLISISYETEGLIYTEPREFTEEHLKWQNDCISTKEWRNVLKSKIIEKCEKHVDSICRSKLVITSPYFYHCYMNFLPELIDSWIKIWKEAKIEDESLENLILYYKLMFICADPYQIEQARINRKKIEEDAEEFMRDEIKYWSNEENCIRDSDFDNWSDPF